MYSSSWALNPTVIINPAVASKYTFHFIIIYLSSQSPLQSVEKRVNVRFSTALLYN